MACKRLTLGPGYLEALVEGKVDFIHDGIKRFTEDGTVKQRKYDAIICSESFNASFKPRFPLIGLDSVDIHYQNKDESDDHISLGVDRFPTIFVVSTNSGVGTGLLAVILERTCEYAIKTIIKHEWKKSSQ